MKSITPKRLQSLIQKAASKYTSRKNAKYLAIETVEAFARKDSNNQLHTIIENVIGEIEACNKYKLENKITSVNLKSLRKINYQKSGSKLELYDQHKWLTKSASKNGIAMLVLSNTADTGAMHLNVQGLAKQGFVGIAFCNGGPNVVTPFNGMDGLLGTNPIAFGFPTLEGIQVMDMASSALSYGNLTKAKQNNIDVDDNSIIDANGNITNIAAEGFDKDMNSRILPIGNTYKGYIINYAIEIMSGAMIAEKMFNTSSPDYDVTECGAILIAIDPSAFQPLEQFKQNISKANILLRDQKSINGQGVTVPGDKNNSKYKLIINNNKLEIENNIFNKLSEIAK
jgi:LDH2 family malate/lactate/ureidoglycolate dehydrogenase